MDSSVASPGPTLVEAITLILYCVLGLRLVSRYCMVVSLEVNVMVELASSSRGVYDICM